MTPTANLLFEISSLRKIVRAHRAVLLTDDLSDNIASHSFLVSWVALLLAKKEKANVEKVLTMAIIHDVPETRTGDIGWINKRYVKDFEQEAIEAMFTDEIEISDLKVLLAEYHERNTIEAKIVKDADRIAQMMVLKEYVFAFNNQQAKEWTENLTEEWYQSFYTKSGSALIRAIQRVKVNEWAVGLRTDKRR